MALEIRFRIIDLPFDAAKSIDASCVSTLARSLMTWFRIVELTWMGASRAVAAPRGARLRASPSSSRRKMTPRSASHELEER